MRCHITGAALEEMGIQTGQQLWAVFKASSCFLVDEGQGPGSDLPVDQQPL
jgi:molybdopterin-binding protein